MCAMNLKNMKYLKFDLICDIIGSVKNIDI